MGDIIGRYAPSPTGDLHLGNLRTALLAWLQARLQGGKFLLRMEDLDTPRVVKGSDDQILRDLEWLGIDWDGPVVFQSQRHDLYEDALATLESKDLVFPCFCSRRELREIASAPHNSMSSEASSRYLGTCSSLSKAQISSKSKLKHPSTRLRVTESDIGFVDGVQGTFSQSLAAEVGDFVVKRADGLFAYQLAVVVDDIDQNISHVVRGADLLDSTPRQIYLAECLLGNRPSLIYWHTPLVMDKNGQRMAKRDGSDSAQSWRDRGLSAGKLIGQFARELNLVEDKLDITTETLLSEVSIDTLRNGLVKASANQ